MGAFLLAAGLLGGGGFYFPLPELLIECFFVALALVFVWRPSANRASLRDPFPVILVAILALALPALQLIPLPPAVWQSLPARANAQAALDLVGAAQSWRPLSLVPAKTLASLLALVPPAGIFLLIARLGLRDRRVVLYAAAALAILSAFLGAAQLSAPDGHLTLYSPYYAGWVTGFQGGRNGAGDILMAGLLALSALGAGTLATGGRQAQVRRANPLAISLWLFVAALLVLATVMTGSRTSVSRLPLALLACVLIFSVGSDGQVKLRKKIWSAVLGATLLVAIVGLVAVFDTTSPLNRVWQRFADFQENRGQVWQLAMAAWRAYWPVGAGTGAYIEATLPFEPLEFVTENWPNRAHSEYIQVGIEMGIAGYLILAAIVVCLVVLAVRKWRGETTREGHVQCIYGITILALLALHSIVDNPFRSMSIACFAAAAAALITRSPQQLVAEPDRPADLAEPSGFIAARQKARRLGYQRGVGPGRR